MKCEKTGKTKNLGQKFVHFKKGAYLCGDEHTKMRAKGFQSADWDSSFFLALARGMQEDTPEYQEAENDYNNKTISVWHTCHRKATTNW
jgi:hypothetical protein